MKPFRIAAISENRNSFGLRGMVLIARDGEAWQVATNDINSLEKGECVYISGEDFAEHGFEIPQRLPDAPRDVITEVWCG